MIRLAKGWVIVAGLAGLVFAECAAQAHEGWGGSCGNSFGAHGYGVSGSLYGLGRVPVPPYFALHPPVYYSLPVPRTYGYSPYAYPAEVLTPEIAPGPQEVINPHVPQPAEAPAEKKDQPAAKKTSGRVAVAPQVIENPFVAWPNGKLALQPR